MMPAEDNQSILRHVGESKSVTLGPNRVSFLLSGEQTGGKFSLTEFTAAPPPALAAPVHIHQDADETLYILEGDFQVTIEEQQKPVSAGAIVFIRRGTPHTIANVGTNAGKMLVLLSPPGFEVYWAEMAQLLQSSGGSPDQAVVLALQQKYHMNTGGRPRQF